ncbi:MAG: hypothetical protein ABMB14_33460 [Myxococcota bacterium]
MVARAFHDAVIDHLARTSTQLDAMCSMVSVYEDDALLRQESGTLRIVGPVPDGSSEPEAGSEAAYDDASILDLVVKDGVVSLLVEWQNYVTGATDVHRYCRALDTVTWEPAQGGVVVLAISRT